MPKVCVVQVVYNSRHYLKPVFEAIFAQSFKDLEVVAVISGNEDGGKEFLQANFPLVKIIDPRFNIGFAQGHNLVFSQVNSEFFQLVNPDMIMEPNYIEEMLKVFTDKKVGAATGKLYKIASDKFQETREKFNEEKSKFKILDTTGVTISKSGRGRDRGQHELDAEQYDKQTLVQAVSAAGAMYRREALEAAKLLEISDKRQETRQIPKFEYFDEDFHSYWEDVDLAWRMSIAGWQCVFVPTAVGYHGRGAGSSRGGYGHFIDFVKHHQALQPPIRQLNYKNHIFMYLKNSKWLYPQFFVREFFMLLYILVFEFSTLKVLPEIFKLLPKMWKKRKYLLSLKI